MGKNTPPEKYRAVTEKSVLPIYSVGIVVLCYGICFPMTGFFSFLSAGLAAGAVYLLLSSLLPKRVVYRADAPRSELLENGQELRAKLYAAAESTQDPQVRQSIYRIDDAARGLLAWGETHPHENDRLRRFVRFYLPAALRLAEEYCRMEKQNPKGRNIVQTMEKSAAMLEQMGAAFEKLQDDLFLPRAMDINAEITAIKALLQANRLIDKH